MAIIFIALCYNLIRAEASKEPFLKEFKKVYIYILCWNSYLIINLLTYFIKKKRGEKFLKGNCQLTKKKQKHKN